MPQRQRLLAVNDCAANGHTLGCAHAHNGDLAALRHLKGHRPLRRAIVKSRLRHIEQLQTVAREDGKPNLSVRLDCDGMLTGIEPGAAVNSHTKGVRPRHIQRRDRIDRDAEHSADQHAKGRPLMLLQHAGELLHDSQLEHGSRSGICQQHWQHKPDAPAAEQGKRGKAAHKRRHGGLQHTQQRRDAPLARKNEIDHDCRGKAGHRAHAEHQQEGEGIDRRGCRPECALPFFLRAAHERDRAENADGVDGRFDVGVAENAVQTAVLEHDLLRIQCGQPRKQRLGQARAHRLYAQKRVDGGNACDRAHHAPCKRTVKFLMHGNEQEEKHRDEELRALAQMKLAGHRPKNRHPRKRRIAEQQQGREVPDPFAVAEHKQRDHTNAREQRHPLYPHAAEVQQPEHREREPQRRRKPRRVLFPIYPCTHCKSLLSQYFMASLYRFHASVSRRSLAPSIRLCLRCGARHDTINLHQSQNGKREDSNEPRKRKGIGGASEIS